MQRLCIVTLVFLLISGCSARSEQENKQNAITNTSNTKHADEKPLIKREAIQIAEDFIRQNGYTDLPPMEDKSSLSHESIEYSENPDEILSHRYNTLERNAFGVIEGGKDGPGWTVVFQYNPSYKYYHPGIGRAVTMNIYGKDIQVEHIDISLDSVERVTR
jgi:hypothetical protein